VKDRLHFNAEGYKILAAAVRNYLAKVPEPKQIAPAPVTSGTH
jgi:lysophospholipase L1-like esterase